MRRELVDRANKIISLIDDNERAIEELSKYAQTGGTLYSILSHGTIPRKDYKPIEFEDWEIRLMIHQKKQRVQALKAELERL